ncbi:Protein csx2 [Wickerhamiella sorbophila]|uniref:ADP-ribosylation factor GTPase-activating protein n=1 Tax=Wickerhamiella sorbophila TaxID=45607 RepID=A0A2T0FPU7_9ASCO|nr:Protein csx2 [Wickerhamiella sorbophila]PRT56987.1 Protein csx2 [Wickerhamiella sorbophila]
MGQVSSQVEAEGPYQPNSRRFQVRNVQAFVNEGDDGGVYDSFDAINPAPVITAALDSSQSTSSPNLTISRPNGRPIEYVQDPESQQLVVRVPYAPSITFRFKVSMLATSNLGVNSLTFITADKRRQLEGFIDSELLNNPNIQNEENVVLLGDFCSDGDAPRVYQKDFVWTWTPSANDAERPGGWPIHFGFVEYEKNGHRLSPLFCGQFWIGETPVGLDPLLISEFAAQRINSPIQDFSIAETLNFDLMNPEISSPIALRDIYGPTPAAPSGQAAASTSTASKSSITGLQTQQANQQPSGGGLCSPLAPVPVNTWPAHASSLPSETSSASKYLAVRPGAEQTIQPEDGPLFRSTIQQMERKYAGLKAQVKKLLKRSVLMHERLAAAIEASQWFFYSFHQAGYVDLPSTRPVAQFYRRDKEDGFHVIITHSKAQLQNLVKNVIQPLQDFYDQEIKAFDSRKREFDDESSQYYSWMSKYLSNRKKADHDAKYLEKRRAFELSRFDYYSYLLDLHGGRKLQDVIQRVAQYTETLADGYVDMGNLFATKIKPNIDIMVQDLNEAAKDWRRQRTEREERRRLLERTNGEIFGAALSTTKTDQGSTGNNSTHNLPGSESVTNSMLSGSGSEETAPTTHHPEQDDAHKEGLLWAISRPTGFQEQNMQKQVGLKWHKYWVVQDVGRICEYTNWKQGLDLHNDPIDLKTANVREARNADRRFCFEVVTPQYRRVYQATSDDDMRSWISSINRGISRSLEDHSEVSGINPGSVQTDLQVSKPRETKDKLERLGRKLSLKTEKARYIAGGLASAPPISGPSLFGTSVPKSSGVLPNPVPHTGNHHFSLPAPITSPSGSTSLMTLIQKAPSNRLCADCQSSNSVEWVSINLMMVLCIDCSGAHRSLGSHISKVRSLKLDTVSFTQDLVAALTSVSNGVMNSIWEARLSHKPVITDKNRLAFISGKYVEKLYIRDIEKPNTELRQAVVDNDVAKVAAALAARANANVKSDDDEPILVTSLRTAPAGTHSFPIAEILIVNGAQLPQQMPQGLSSAAQSFLSIRAKSSLV